MIDVILAEDILLLKYFLYFLSCRRYCRWMEWGIWWIFKSVFYKKYLIKEFEICFIYSCSQSIKGMNLSFYICLISSLFSCFCPRLFTNYVNFKQVCIIKKVLNSLEFSIVPKVVLFLEIMKDGEFCIVIS